MMNQNEFEMKKKKRISFANHNNIYNREYSNNQKR